MVLLSSDKLDDVDRPAVHRRLYNKVIIFNKWGRAVAARRGEGVALLERGAWKAEAEMEKQLVGGGGSRKTAMRDEKGRKEAGNHK